MPGEGGFTPLSVQMNLEEGGWAHVGELIDGQIEQIGMMPGATARGKPAVGFLIKLPDGRHVGAWTTWNLLYSAARAFEGRYGPATD